MDKETQIIGYSKNNYRTFFKSLVLIYQPKEIVEIGIGEGYTLSALLAGAEKNGFGRIRAYDIFEKWKYFHKANYENIIRKFGGSKQIEIMRGDFFEIYRNLKDNSIGLFNIDIAMDGSKYEFFIRYYLRKLKSNGLAILEGGSQERDGVHWMRKYNFQSIRSALEKFKRNISYFVIEPFPSATLIRKKT